MTEYGKNPAGTARTEAQWAAAVAEKVMRWEPYEREQYAKCGCQAWDTGERWHCPGHLGHGTPILWFTGRRPYKYARMFEPRQSAADDFDVLVHVRGAWFSDDQAAFTREVERLWKRHPRTAWLMDGPLNYDVGDYARAALAVVEAAEAAKKKNDGDR